MASGYITAKLIWDLQRRQLPGEIRSARDVAKYLERLADQGLLRRAGLLEGEPAYTGTQSGLFQYYMIKDKFDAR